MVNKKKTYKIIKKTRRKKYRNIKQNGGINSGYNNIFNNFEPSWLDRFSRLVTIISQATDNLRLGMRPMYLYGTSMPIPNTYKCLATMIFYMNVKNIKRFISLQGCGVMDENIMPYLCDTDPITQDIPGADPLWSKRIWESIKNMTSVQSLDINIVYNNYKIRDFESGTIQVWEQLNDVDYNNINQPVIIHCYAGYGRTGTILFFYAFKNYIMTNIDILGSLLDEPYLGMENSINMYRILKNFFTYYLSNDTNHNENGVIQDKINMFNIELIIDEVFNIHNLNQINMFISRINYILLFITISAYGYDKKIYLYRLITDASNIVDIFIPVRLQITTDNLMDDDIHELYGFSLD